VILVTLTKIVWGDKRVHDKQKQSDMGNNKEEIGDNNLAGQPYPAKLLPPQGLFISSIKPKADRPPILAPSPTSTAIRKALSPPKIILKYFHPQQSQISQFSISTDTSISPTQLPNTSLPIAITNAIGSPKSHRNLEPFLWDLIEATIKCKRQ
jgi:hypothetical protein